MKTIARLFLSLIIILTTLSSAHAAPNDNNTKVITGDSKITQKSVTLNQFDVINVNGNFDIVSIFTRIYLVRKPAIEFQSAVGQ